MKSIREVGALAKHTYGIVSLVVVDVLYIPVLVVHDVRNMVMVHSVRCRVNYLSRDTTGSREAELSREAAASIRLRDLRGCLKCRG